MKKRPVEVTLLTIGTIVLTTFQVVSTIYSLYLLETSKDFVEMVGKLSPNAIVQLDFKLQAYIGLILTISMIVTSILLLKPNNRYRLTFVALLVVLIGFDYSLTGNSFYLAIKIPVTVVIGAILFNPRANKFYSRT